MNTRTPEEIAQEIAERFNPGWIGTLGWPKLSADLSSAITEARAEGRRDGILDAMRLAKAQSCATAEGAQIRAWIVAALKTLAAGGGKGER